MKGAYGSKASNREKNRCSTWMNMIVFLVIIILLGMTCFAAADEGIRAITLEAEDITETSAVLIGQVNKKGGSDYVGYNFFIKEADKDDTAYREVEWISIQIDSNEDCEYEITGLKPGTEYEYYFYAVSENTNIGNNGVLYGFPTETFETKSEECDHEYEEEVIDDEWDYDSEEHWYRERIEYTCDECGDSYTEWTDEEYESHNFDKRGECKDCGYQEEGCRHEDVEYTYLRTEFDDIGDAEEHERRDEYADICQECGEQVGEEEWTEWTREAHRYEGDTCAWCGYEKEEEEPEGCRHARVEYIYLRTEFDDIGDAEEHERRDEYADICQECGEQVGDEEWTEWTREAHRYEGDTCAWCGYEKEEEEPEGCRHARVEYTYVILQCK